MLEQSKKMLKYIGAVGNYSFSSYKKAPKEAINWLFFVNQTLQSNGKQDLFNCSMYVTSKHMPWHGSMSCGSDYVNVISVYFKNDIHN